MTKEKICIAYCGEAVDTGMMDINDLAPALLSFGELIYESNKIANKDSSKINVYVSSQFQRGSFEISIEIFQTLADQLKGLFTAGQTYSINDLLYMIGIASNVGGVTGINLLELIRWVKGRKIDSVNRIDADKCRVNIGDESKEISILGLNLFRSVKIRKSIEGIITPLNQEGIEAFEVRESNVPCQRIDDTDKEYFNVPDDDIEPEVLESTRRCLIKVSSVNFEKDLKWRFSTDSMKFYATISDDDFLKRVEEGEISFAKGVSLLVDLHEVQNLHSNGDVKTDYVVMKVYRVIGQSEQLSLNFK